MRVVLMRHGPAVDRDDPACPPDPERPLTTDGRARTRAAAAGLRALDVRPELVLASPYLRAAQTAGIVCETLGLAAPEITEHLLPGADPVALARELASRGAADVLCAGHEPHLGLALACLVEGRAVSDSFADLKKAGAACVETEHPGTRPGTLLWLLPPRVLRRLGGAT